MKKIFLFVLICLFFTLLFPHTSEAVCCQKRSGTEVVGCNDEVTSETDCNTWGAPVSRWFPDVINCDYFPDCTNISGEIPIADPPSYDLEVPLGSTTNVSGFNEYIKILYRFGVGLIVGLALFFIVF